MAIGLGVRHGLGLSLAHGRNRHQAYNKRECCARALACAGCSVTGEVRFPSRSAPVFDDQWVLSLAHSGPWLLAGAARVVGQRTCIGVDVEQCKNRDFNGIGRFLGWPSRSRDEAHFYRRWTLAEALFKAAAQEAARWFKILEPAAEDTESAACFDAAGWRWRAWWPELASGACVCLVLGAEQ